MAKRPDFSLTGLHAALLAELRRVFSKHSRVVLFLAFFEWGGGPYDVCSGLRSRGCWHSNGRSSDSHRRSRLCKRFQG